MVTIEIKKIPIPNLGVGPDRKNIIHIKKILKTETIIPVLLFFFLKNMAEKTTIIEKENIKFKNI